jgi:hypothetical protein
MDKKLNVWLYKNQLTDDIIEELRSEGMDIKPETALEL